MLKHNFMCRRGPKFVNKTGKNEKILEYKSMFLNVVYVECVYETHRKSQARSQRIVGQGLLSTLTTPGFN